MVEVISRRCVDEQWYQMSFTAPRVQVLECWSRHRNFEMKEEENHIEGTVLAQDFDVGRNT